MDAKKTDKLIKQKKIGLSRYESPDETAERRRVWSFIIPIWVFLVLIVIYFFQD